MSARLTFVGWGGMNPEAQARAWLEPFAATTGIEIVQVGPPDYAELMAMVEQGRVTWDVVVVGAGFGLARHGRYLEPIDYGRIERDRLLAGFASEYRVADLVYSVVLAYNTRTVGGRIPSGWIDFYDPVGFPGRRVTFDFVQYGAFESALLADDVAASALYPLDLDRAFRRLDSIKRELIWCSTIDEAETLLASGEATMGLFSQNHTYLALRKSPDLAIQWRGQLLLAEYLVVPRGTSNREAAMELVAEIVSPAAQGRLSDYLCYGPVHRDARPNPAMAPYLPTSHLDVERAGFDDEHWVEHFEEINGRFRAWRAS